MRFILFLRWIHLVFLEGLLLWPGDGKHLICGVQVELLSADAMPPAVTMVVTIGECHGAWCPAPCAGYLCFPLVLVVGSVAFTELPLQSLFPDGISPPYYVAWACLMLLIFLPQPQHFCVLHLYRFLRQYSECCSMIFGQVTGL